MRLTRDPVQIYSAVCALIAGAALTIVVAQGAGAQPASATTEAQTAARAALERSASEHRLALAREAAARRRYQAARRAATQRERAVRQSVLAANRAVRQAARTGAG